MEIIKHSFLSFRFPLILFVITLAILSAYHLARTGFFPDFFGYFDYVISFQGGFGYNPRSPDGADNFLLLIFSTLFITTVFTSTPRQRPLATGILFGCWAVGSYYVGRSHEQNVLNILPLFSLGFLGFIIMLRDESPKSLSTLWLRSILTAIALAWIPWILFVFYRDARHQFRLKEDLQVSLQRPVAALNHMGDADHPPLNKFLDWAQLEQTMNRHFDRATSSCVVNLENYWFNDIKRQYFWTPFLDSTLFDPLNSQLRAKYTNRYLDHLETTQAGVNCPQFWIAHKIKLSDAKWKIVLLENRYRIVQEITDHDWRFIQLVTK